ncbi:sensor histidine kinase [Streptomyces sp. NPDC057900]|uniref:sensor histidine kinase n=1 Tax=Streptomyces sp. NPDC057900 TaxID=3346274 RepID=UPI0036EB742F
MVPIRDRRSIVFDVMAALGFTLLPQLSPLRPALGGELSGTTVWLLSLSAALPLTVRQLWPSPVFGVTLVAACAALPFGLGPTSFLAAAYALYLVALRRQPGRSAVLVGGVCAAGAALLTMTGSQHYEGGTRAVQAVFGVLVLGATWAAGSAARERRAGVERVIDQAAERAKVEERLRIARDIHDVVTHSVGLIAVRAGIANHVAETRPEEAREALVMIEGVSRQALRDMRATLRVLRREDRREDQEEAAARDLRPVPGLLDLPALVRMAEAAGVGVDLRSHCPQEPPDGVATSAFRIVQEALTNVVKHAAPTRCSVRIVAAEGVLTVEVADEGPGTGHRPTVPGGGLGLVGMRERADAHGGTFTAGAGPDGGFRVAVTLPY